MTKIPIPLFKWCFWLCLGILLISCANPKRIRNPVVFIHGTMGSVLINKDGKIIWGKLTPNQAPESDLALPLRIPIEREAKKIDEKKYRIIDEKVLGVETPIVNINIQVGDVYRRILDHLKSEGYDIHGEKDGGVGIKLIEESSGIGWGIASPILGYKPETTPATHTSALLFSYDWRKSNAENAGNFHQFLQNKRSEIQDSTLEEIKELRRNGNVGELEFANDLEEWLKNYRFDVIAHSMGGLIARYFLRYGDQQLSDDSQVVSDWRGESHI